MVHLVRQRRCALAVGQRRKTKGGGLGVPQPAGGQPAGSPGRGRTGCEHCAGAEGGAQYFSSNVELSISLSVPSWIPIGTAAMEKQGSKALDKMLDSDVAPLIEKFKDKYTEWLVA